MRTVEDAGPYGERWRKDYPSVFCFAKSSSGYNISSAIAQYALVNRCVAAQPYYSLHLIFRNTNAKPNEMGLRWRGGTRERVEFLSISEETQMSGLCDDDGSARKRYP